MLKLSMLEKPSVLTCSSLVEAARKARKLSYSPYSHFAVGAAVLDVNGKMTTGTNVENSSFSLAMCAERIALFRAHMEGLDDILAIAVSAGAGIDVKPCGACLQVIMEMAPTTWLVLDDGAGGYKSYTIDELYPHPFRLKEQH